ncbi:dihydrodipicolinate synthase family protein [Pseudogracilibacillus sp. SE30717A]|uniref:dihydrodipicolinate synthase family protein n=1 Tax=Pseudogracilibacillus sp. SE30717A TaxID=3098293 RepID=UPI00300E1BC6
MLTNLELDLLHDGAFIPAHPLALTNDKQLDEKHQRALTKYYIDAGVDGIAVGVHTTQFEIRDPNINLYEKVLRIAMEEIEEQNMQRPFLKLAGICGGTEQAIKEAQIAKDLGYHLGLLSFGGLGQYTEDDLLKHTEEVAKIIPVFGFYLQPAVGGRELSFDFWKGFAEIPNVHAIKIAPFNRYKTLDVVRAVCHSSRNDDIALYTGNDDNIVIDLLSNYQIRVGEKTVNKQIVGGLLGHWAVWTKNAVNMFQQLKKARKNKEDIAPFLSLANEVTDANAAFFDTANNFKGCIAGINEVLRRQGLLKGNWCLLDSERLSAGQSEEIDRVYQEYPHLHDDTFIKENLQKWLK